MTPRRPIPRPLENPDEMPIAVYMRVSSKDQRIDSQEPDINRWLAENQKGRKIFRFVDKWTAKNGQNMLRPEWQRLEKLLDHGKVGCLLVWRLDRLGRSTFGMVSLFQRLLNWNIRLVSVREGFDLATPTGKLVATITASMAEFENAVRSERIKAGMEAARAKGKRIGGHKKGVPAKLKPRLVSEIVRMKRAGVTAGRIAKACGVSRATVYVALEQSGEEDLVTKRRPKPPQSGQSAPPEPAE